ncbi:hypothetical protein F5X71_28430 [Nocardia brasiliensis]|uniref:Uncharacterized protein n=1 Tax=Nocardia brasiliensis TaxID=37326 RepID=A0A6G9XXZ8_NOCBR|nr:hypothetical protein [Nocardia brasiliensis]QIS05713.1 hypothetical protein F5X71_28430 [Nocardia brasiliensis]
MTDCEYYTVDLDQLARPLDATSTDHDITVAGALSSPLLRRLIHTAVGLSTDSIDLLATMTDRLRSVEGIIIRDPLEL